MNSDDKTTNKELTNIQRSEFIAYLKTLADPVYVNDMLDEDEGNLSLIELIRDIAADCLLFEDKNADTKLLIAMHAYFIESWRWPWGFDSTTEIEHYKIKCKVNQRMGLASTTTTK